MWLFSVLQAALFLPLISTIDPLQARASVVRSGPPALDFHVSSGGNDNYFLRDDVTSGQILLTSANNTSTLRRLVVALPAGNNGALTYFLPLTNTNTSPLSVTLVNGTIKSTTDEFNNAGIQADLLFGASATLGVTIVGAVRALRDYVEGSGTMHEIFNYTLAEHSSTSVRLHRHYINSTSSSITPSSSNSSRHPKPLPPDVFKGVDLYLSIPQGSSARLSVTPGHNGTFTPPKIDIIVPHEDDSHSRTQSPILRVRVLTNETSLVGLDTQSLFLTQEDGSTLALQTALDGLANGTNTVANQVSFLTYQNKFTAGGWRFLTYFGRDSMIALRLLMPLMTSDAIESALEAVIERANSTGALCHEETIGDYASFINIGNNQSNLGNQPFYDYKMIDTDLLLLPAVSHYFLELPQGANRSAAFIAKSATLQNGTYGDILNRIATYNINRALPFFQNASHSTLLAFRPGQPVGNWRDSNQGTGYGPIPFDVNSALVPANLRATDSLIQAKILPQSNVDVATVASAWEANAPGFFDVTVNSTVADQRLQDFVARANLSDVLLQDVNATAGDVTFYALSLMEDGSPVEVLNSDLGFNLMYGANVSATFLGRVIDALMPYPRGLLTNVGMLVANPAYDSNRTNIQVLDRTAYHGTVIWSFQQGLMAGGIARQLGLCGIKGTASVDINSPPIPRPSWCDDANLIQGLQDAETRLWDSINGAFDNINSEVWSYSFNNSTNSFSVADLASLSPDGTESDAIQLWSYGFLGLLDPTTGR